MGKKIFEGEPIHSSAAIEEARQALKDQRSVRLGAALPPAQSNVVQLVQAGEAPALDATRAVNIAHEPMLTVAHAAAPLALEQAEAFPARHPQPVIQEDDAKAEPARAAVLPTTTSPSSSSRQRRGNRRKPDKSVIVRSDGSTWRQRSVYLEAEFSRAIDIYCAEVQQDITHVLSDWIREGYERGRKARK